MAEGEDEGSSGDGAAKGKAGDATPRPRSATGPRGALDPSTPVPSSGPRTPPVSSVGPKTPPVSPTGSGKSPPVSASTLSSASGKNPPVSASTLSSASGKTAPVSASSAKSSAKTAPVGATSASAKPAGRRPLVSKEAKEQKAALAAAAPKPFYKRIPKNVAWVLLALVAIAALIPAGMWGYAYYQRAKNPDEYAVREQLNNFRFDDDKTHFANLDAMGTKAVDISIRLLTDRTPAEIPNGKSTTSAGELATMYLMHYAVRVKVEPPPKAVEASRNGLTTLSPGQWTDLQQAWTTWFADVQAKGLALK